MNKRAFLHKPRHLCEQVADSVTTFMGSWHFVIGQSVLLALWIMLNTVGWWVWKWDLYPYIAMNLLLSCQAAYASPLILMSQNRAATRDHARDDLEAQEVQSLVDNNELLLQINRQQLEILHLLKGGPTLYRRKRRKARR